MANPEHLEILKQGVGQWNKWREENVTVKPDLKDANLREAKLVGIHLSNAILSNADLTEAYLTQADLSGTNLKSANLVRANLNSSCLRRADLREANLSLTDLRGADLRGADLRGADLGGAGLCSADLGDANLSKAELRVANLRGANLFKTTLIDANLLSASLSDADLRGARMGGVNLSRAQLRGADLRGAYLGGANLSNADLSGAKLCDAQMHNADLGRANLTDADLTDANLICTNLMETDFTDATISGCLVYGVSAWNVKLANTSQDNLRISSAGDPIITVDNLEVAQFIYLMLNNTKIRDVINTITSKGVLILGRFSDPERKSVLDGLRDKLRGFDLLPIVFDFDRPTDKDYTETVQTLAGMSMFVIVDVTNPKSTPLELEATVKQFKIPYVPIIDVRVDPHPFAMLADLQKSCHWVLDTLEYESGEDLLDDENLKTYVIDPVNAKREELREAKNREPERRRISRKKVTTPPS